MKEVRGSGLVTEEEFEGIAYKNAESLLRVRVQFRGIDCICAVLEIMYIVIIVALFSLQSRFQRWQ